MTGPIHRLELRFDMFNGRPNRPVVRIFVDGEEPLATGHGLGGFVGFDPRQILQSGALLPTEPARRIALYRCSCGEPGCGCVASVIERHGEKIVWSDPRDFVGVYHVPIHDGDITSAGKPYDFGDLVFDAAPYLAEVERATNDTSWETTALLIERLLTEHLDASRDELVDVGYHLSWVAPFWEDDREFRVAFIGPDGQVVVALSPSAATPQDQAREMADALVHRPPETWPVTSRSDWPPDVVARAIELVLKRVQRRPT
jgi:hypothetical protein